MTKLESTVRGLRSQFAGVSADAWVFLLISVLALVQTSCRTAPMVHADALAYSAITSASGSDSATADRVRSAITTGSRRAGWTTEEREPGTQTIHARFTVQPQVYVTVAIDYGGDDGGGEISLRYEDSSNFKCDGLAGSCSSIHKRYNTQLLRLREQIQQALTEPSTQPIGLSQAVSIVRQVIEEQPRRTAYLAVDVTEERVTAVREVVRPVHHPGADVLGWGFHGHRGFYGYPLYGGVSYVSTSETDVVYFNNIGRIELRTRRNGQSIQIWDRYGESRMRLYSPDEWLAKRFVDAVGVLEQARLKIEEDYLKKDYLKGDYLDEDNRSPDGSPTD